MVVTFTVIVVISISCCLHWEHCVNSGMCHRSDCRLLLLLLAFRMLRHGLPLWLSELDHCAAMHMACMAISLRRSGFESQALQHVSSYRLISAYSDINHRGSACVLLSL